MNALPAAAGGLPPALIALTPGALGARDSVGRAALDRAARAVLEVGDFGLLLREPEAFDLELLELARGWRDSFGARPWIAIHDRVHLLASGLFDAVQLGHRSLDPTQARTIAAECSPTAAIGFSAHRGDPEEAGHGADYLLLAPVFSTASHPDPEAPDFNPPLGRAGFCGELARERRPIWAMGGIDATTIAEVRSWGAAGVCLRSSLLGLLEPSAVRRAAVTISEAWRGVRP